LGANRALCRRRRQVRGKVDYIVDGPTLLGTGGAIYHAPIRLAPEFLVTYSDSWLDAPYAPVVEAFRATGQPALMCVYRNENRWTRAMYSSRMAVFVVIPRSSECRRCTILIGGSAVLKASAVAAFPMGAPWELSSAGRLAGYEMTRRFCEIGSFEGLAETRSLLSSSLA
jgi:NDP-sugar pyrophosphorylase family protein